MANAKLQRLRALLESLRVSQKWEPEGLAAASRLTEQMLAEDMNLLAGWDLLATYATSECQLCAKPDITVVDSKGDTLIRASLIEHQEIDEKRLPVIQYLDIRKVVVIHEESPYHPLNRGLKRKMGSLLFALQIIRDDLDEILFTLPQKLRNHRIGRLARMLELDEAHFRALAMVFPRIADHVT